ncbi:MAG TPA: redoxin domain-containing protein [Solirubrobacterales bacterium]|nr:redoxin domain-containing protein [Solirubrobacterales bacterium]
MIEVGARAPDFRLADHSGQEVTLSDFSGRRLLLAFYPLDFSPVCSDQLTLYRQIQPQLDSAGVTLVGVSVDSAFAHAAFRNHLDIEMPLLADFEPKGEVAEAYGAYLGEAGHTNRSLVLIDQDGVVEWVHETATPLDIPGPELIVEAIQA